MTGRKQTSGAFPKILWPVNNYLNVQNISSKYNSWDILTFYGSEELLLNLISEVWQLYG